MMNQQKKIGVFTGTRAEYGLLYWLMKDIQEDTDLHLQLLVSGMHLSPEFGLTYRQIENDGFSISEKVEILLSSDSPMGVAKSIGLGVLGFTDALTRMSPDMLVILGDRFEALAAAQTAMILRIPILHLHGGEITEGAYDDAIRHAISKLSSLHAASTEVYRRRLIQMGEMPKRIENVGAIGLDHLQRSRVMSRTELAESLGIKLDKPFFLVTYHPVTLADELPERSFDALTSALDEFSDHQIILTYPNADDGGRKIIPLIETYTALNADRVMAIPSLGQARYLSAISYCDAVIGNSSSGIIEVPSFYRPTVDIGDRQKGRMAAESVFHCGANSEEITATIKKALLFGASEKIKEVTNPYGSGNASKKIIKMIKNCDLSVVKSFYDVDFDLQV